MIVSDISLEFLLFYFKICVKTKSRVPLNLLGFRSASAGSSVTSRSRSHSRASSGSRHQSTFRLSLVSAVASRNLIDDDGSLRATDLSSFRIPKKKRFYLNFHHLNHFCTRLEKAIAVHFIIVLSEMRSDRIEK